MSNNSHDRRGDDHVYNLTPADRIVERTQGCWNCTGFASCMTSDTLGAKMVKDKWEADRQRDLTVALEIAISNPINGMPNEEHQQVRNIRRMVDNMDHAIAQGAFGICLRSKAPGDYVNARYLCNDGWIGRDGASVARGTALPDKSSDELREDKK